LVSALDVVIEILHQQGPVALSELSERRWAKGAVQYPPRLTAAAAHHDARLHLLVARQAHELGWIDDTCEAWSRASHQQRSLLPMTSEELPGRGPAEEGAQGIASHAPRIIGVRIRWTGRGVEGG